MGIGDCTGRGYRLFDYHGHPEAERVLVLAGSGAEVAHEVFQAWLPFAIFEIGRRGKFYRKTHPLADYVPVLVQNSRNALANRSDSDQADPDCVS